MNLEQIKAAMKLIDAEALKPKPVKITVSYEMMQALTIRAEPADPHLGIMGTLAGVPIERHLALMANEWFAVDQNNEIMGYSGRKELFELIVNAPWIGEIPERLSEQPSEQKPAVRTGANEIK